jgi:hypothetical protein
MKIKINEVIDNTLDLSSYSVPSLGKGFTHIRNFILQASRSQSNTSMVYRETLKTMLIIFGKLTYFDSENKIVRVQCLHANPERSVAKLKQENNIILPIISVSQNTSEDDSVRIRYNNLVVQEKIWDEEKQRAFRVVSLAPKATNILYSVNVWAKYKSDMDQLVEQIRSEFNPGKVVPTKFNKYTKAFLDREEDMGSIQAVEREDRILKKAFNITVETYIPSPKFLITSSGKIEHFNSEIYPVSGTC